MRHFFKNSGPALIQKDNCNGIIRVRVNIVFENFMILQYIVYIILKFFQKYSCSLMTIENFHQNTISVQIANYQMFPQT